MFKLLFRFHKCYVRGRPVVKSRNKTETIFWSCSDSGQEQQLSCCCWAGYIFSQHFSQWTSFCKDRYKRLRVSLSQGVPNSGSFEQLLLIFGSWDGKIFNFLAFLFWREPKSSFNCDCTKELLCCLLTRKKIGKFQRLAPPDKLVLRYKWSNKAV